jgi:ABC-type multidrug transport system ATPase subunit
VIALEGVTKEYVSLVRRRRVRAVDDFSLQVHTGEILGIAGPNGAGKSTLLNMLLGFLHPTRGRVTLEGMAPRAYVEARGVGYLSELVAIPAMWNVVRALHRYAVLAGVPHGERGPRVERVMALLGLAEHRGKRVKQLSKGNLQRLGLAQALLSESDLVILDEPTHGFDPIWTQRFRDIANDLRRPGRTVIIASHNLDELERVADRVAIIDRGRLQRVAVIGDHAADARVSYRLVLDKISDAVAQVFQGAVPIPGGQPGEYLVPTLELPALNAGLMRLIGGGANVVAVVPERSRLEAAFREAVGESQ